MRLVWALMTLYVLLAGCERYTEKKSPCFGNTGKPIVTRAVQAPLTFSSLSSAKKNKTITKDCVFENLGKPLE